MYTKICLRHKLGPFGEIGANFPVQLSWRSLFAHFETKKVIAENQCEKHKSYSLEKWKMLRPLLFWSPHISLFAVKFSDV